MIKRLLWLVGRWARKPVNHTNRMDVVCCHLIDRPQSVPQLPYNRTLQFPKTFRLNMNAIFSRSNNAVTPLGKSFKCYMYTILMHCKEIFACSCPRLHSCCGEWEGGPCKTGKPHQLGGCSYSNWPSEVGPQPLCNRTFLWRCLCCHCPFDISVGVGAFVIGLSQISSFFSCYAKLQQMSR